MIIKAYFEVIGIMSRGRELVDLVRYDKEQFVGTHLECFKINALCAVTFPHKEKKVIGLTVGESVIGLDFWRNLAKGG